MYDKYQFILEKRQADESGKIYMDKKHYPIYYTNLLNVPNLSPVIDYSVICAEQNIYELSAGQSVYFLILQDY